MGEENLAQTRLAVDAKRAELQQTAAQLRDALDIRQRFRENPALFIGVGAAAVFVIAGGPGRVAGAVRRQFFPTNPEKAYDSLPKPMQAWVDHMAGAVGPRAGEACSATSATARLPPDPSTIPTCHQGMSNESVGPEPERGQATSLSTSPSSVTQSDVPPTPVTYGLADGVSVCAESPVAATTVIPSAAAICAAWWYWSRTAGGSESSRWANESVMIDTSPRAIASLNV